MTIQKTFAKKIYFEKFNKWNSVTDRIYSFAIRNKVDPYILLSIYYIESYFRPAWFQRLEIIFYNLRILTNPSIGPFQVRMSNLKTSKRVDVIDTSLYFILTLLKKSKLATDKYPQNVIRFGTLYNLDPIYGLVMLELLSLLNKGKWQMSR